jgi:hypothetical protein
VAGRVRDLADAVARRPRAGVPVGRRHLREGRPGEGRGRHARGPRWIARRPQGDPGRRERPPRVDGELARRPARSPAPGPARAPRRGGRRPSWDLGRVARGLPDGRRATVLEPPPPEPPRQGAHATARPRRRVCSPRSPTPRRARKPSGRSGPSRPGQRSVASRP